MLNKFFFGHIDFEHPVDKYMSFCYDIYLPTYMNIRNRKNSFQN